MIQVHGPTEYAERKTLMTKQTNISGNRNKTTTKDKYLGKQSKRQNRQMSQEIAKNRPHKQISQ